MLEIARGWNLEIDRGPDWLFARIHCDPEFAWDSPPLAETLWKLLSQHLAHRLVIECDQMTFMPSSVLGQLVMLQKRIVTSGGQLRITGLSPSMREVLRVSRLDSCLPVFANRAEAVMGVCPNKPR
jgi:anti-anti-sigma factor